MDYSKIEGHSHLLRNKTTNAIVNNNMSEYQEYIMRKNAKNEENQKMQKLESEVGSIKNDLNEIKSLLRSLVNGS